MSPLQLLAAKWVAGCILKYRQHTIVTLVQLFNQDAYQVCVFDQFFSKNLVNFGQLVDDIEGILCILTVLQFVLQNCQDVLDVRNRKVHLHLLRFILLSEFRIFFKNVRY